MPDLIRGGVYLFVVLCILVIAHEAGHFAAARWCRMRVEDFSIFMGPVLLRLGRWGETAFHLRAIPFGGFVRIVGMEPEEISGGVPVLQALRDAAVHGDTHRMDRALRQMSRDTMSDIDPGTVDAGVRDTIIGAIDANGRLSGIGVAQVSRLREDLSLSEGERRFADLVLNAHARSTDPGAYGNKSWIKRAVVIAAGPFASLLFGYVTFCAMGMTIGLPNPKHPTTQIAAIVPTGEAKRAGLRIGDRIVAVNGTRMPNGKVLVDRIHGSIGVPLLLDVERGNRQFQVRVVPRRSVFKTKGRAPEVFGVIGITPNMELERFGVWRSVKIGTLSTIAFVEQLVTILSDRKQAQENVGGPIAMGQMATAVQRLGPGPMMLQAAEFSIGLFVINLLPIPVLDGGHLLLLFVELVRRRKLSPREAYRAQAVGLGVLALLFVTITYNDISRIVAGRGIN